MVVFVIWIFSLIIIFESGFHFSIKEGESFIFRGGIFFDGVFDKVGERPYMRIGGEVDRRSLMVRQEKS